jgi:hypothetical protein
MGPADLSVASTCGLDSKKYLTSPPVTFLSAYFDICFLSSLFAAYFPTMAAMMEMCWKRVWVLEEVKLEIKGLSRAKYGRDGLIIRRGRRRQRVVPEIAVGDDWYTARLTETRRARRCFQRALVSGE